MNRTIKFRGKRVDNGEWVYGAFVPDALEQTHSDMVSWGFICRYYDSKSEMIEVDRKTVGEYTGFKDKNGRKIFEGDIVGFEDGMSTESGYAESGCTGCVSWDKETASFQVDNRLSAESYEVLEECAIIGNIYDNPELLQEG